MGGPFLLPVFAFKIHRDDTTNSTKIRRGARRVVVVGVSNRGFAICLMPQSELLPGVK